MATAVKLSDEFIKLAKLHAAAEHRSVPKQIEYWARLGKAVEDNPELPCHLIKDTLLAIAEANTGQLSEYKYGYDVQSILDTPSCSSKCKPET